ncbi:transmembrane protein, putative (macronuclear) [Tetrahymena thermophila SB210]|uniref:Transmembrane protein, putative n=1 Tax=Tetrahymena thermophila (strain SB210) TaxID=312017 RepID=I7MGZ8_TETTS|nr:transmembrane protein, putative [Tetrahymena thermophila SB210]EAR85627.2 transmembrane protein, putative [Tetrahymena thermophila SB210]|eukprot:XP_001033290.2 transmembrane protein, putative [Tetrahymena thermophila SB210]
MTFCNNGYCLYNGYCLTYSNNQQQIYQDKQIYGVDFNNVCINSNTNTRAQYCSNNIDSICSSIEGYCFKINSSYPIGKLSNTNQCIQANQIYNQPIYNCYRQTDTLVCLYQNNNQYGCFLFGSPYSNSQNIVGIGQNESNYYYTCYQQQQGTPFQCISGYCIDDKTNNCYQFDKTQNRIGTQQGTYLCLPYNPGVNQNPIECISNYCLLKKASISYCQSLGQDYVYCKSASQVCLADGQFSSSPIIQSSLEYCSYQFTIFSNYYCQLTDKNNSSRQAKAQDGSCQSFSSSNSIYCAFGNYCLYQSKCIDLDYAYQTYNLPARLKDSTCSSEGVTVSTYCASKYCIYAQRCVQLNPYQLIGKEINTTNCLLEGQTSQYGAAFCYEGYCKRVNPFTSIIECIKIQDEATWAIDTNGMCLSKVQAQSATNIQYCIPNRYCLDPSGYCRLTQPNECIDQNYRCANQLSTTQCRQCNLSQCLIPQTHTCIQVTPEYCIGYDNQCQLIDPIKPVMCKACARNACYFSASKTCSSFQSIYLQKTYCIKWNDYDQNCTFQNMDNQNDMCGAQDGQCISMSTNKCLKCNSYTVQIGDLKCYTADQITIIKQQSQQNSGNTPVVRLFQQIINYVKEDVYFDQNNQTQICSNGCAACNSGNNCTRCSQDYFLFKNIQSQQQICLSCNVPSFQYNDYPEYSYIQLMQNSAIGQFYQLSNYYSNIIGKCSQCNTNLNQWYMPQLNNLLQCSSYDMQYGQLQRFTTLPNIPSYFKVVQANNNQFQLIQSSPPASKCKKSNCQTCSFDNSGLETCLNCEKFYTLNLNNQCISCPINCTSCFYGGFLNGQSMNWNQNTDYYDWLKKQTLTPQLYNLYCYECNQGFTLRQSCQQQQSQCIDMQYGDDASRISFSLNYYFLPRTQASTFFHCFKCMNTPSSRLVAIINSDKTSSCDASKAQIIGCTYEVQYQISGIKKIYCLQCDNNMVFHYEDSLQCYGFCNLQILGCQSCYSYQAQDSKSLIYQCTQCNQGMHPTFTGCQYCPTGCSTCYEISSQADTNKEIENLTNQIIYYNIQNTVQDRLNYNKNNSYRTICTTCQQGYILDTETNLCKKSSCGDNCGWCQLINQQPICIYCNTALMNQIFQLQQYIVSLYQLSALKQDDIVNFSNQKDNCYLCPFACKTCNTTDTSQQSTNLYNTQCFSCKDINKINTPLKQDYEFRYDNERQRCTLCKRNDQSCYYTKNTTIYAQCKNLNSQIGDGTINNPINLLRTQEVKWDQVILNEDNYLKSVVYLNELSIKELYVNIILLGDQCEVDDDILIKTTLMQQFQSLRVLNITILNSQRVQTGNIFQPFYKLKIYNQILISGFSHVTFKNVNIIQHILTYSSNTVKIQGWKNIQSVEFIQVNIISNVVEQIQQKFQNMYYASFQIQLVDLQQSLKLSEFQMLAFQLQKSTFFKLTNQQSNPKNITLDFNQVQIQQNKLINSVFLEVQSEIVNFINKNFLLINNQLTNSSQLFNFNAQSSLSYVNSQQSQINIVNNTVQNLSCFFLNPNYIQNNIYDIVIENNMFANILQSHGVYNFNLIQIVKMSIKNNIFKNQILFQSLQQSSQLTQQQYSQQVSTFLFSNLNILLNQVQNQEIMIVKIVGSQGLSQQINIRDVLINQQVSNVQQMSCFIFSISNLNTAIIQDLQYLNSNYPSIISTNGINHLVIKNIVLFYDTSFINSINQYLLYLSNTAQNLLVKNVKANNLKSTNSIIMIDNQLLDTQLPFNSQSQVRIQDLIFDNNSLNVVNVISTIAAVRIFSIQQQVIFIDNILFQKNSIYLSKDTIYLGTESGSGLSINASRSTIYITKSLFQDQFSQISRNTLVVEALNLNIVSTKFQNTANIDSYQLSNTQGCFLFASVCNLQISKSIFTRGFAQSGGAIYLQPIKQALHYLNDVEIDGNISSFNQVQSQGGGVFLDTSKCESIDLYIKDSIIQNNYSLQSGGALYVINSLTKIFISISSCIFMNNFSGADGSSLSAIFPNQSKGNLLIENSSFLYNQQELDQNLFRQAIKYFNSNSFLQSSILNLGNFVNVVIQNNIFRNIQSYQLSKRSLKANNQNIVCMGTIVINQCLSLLDKQNSYQNIQQCQSAISINCQIISIDSSNYRQIQDFQISTTQNMPNSQDMNYLILYSAQFLIDIRFANFENIICQYCQRSSLILSSKTVKITSSTFTNNTSNNGGALLFNDYQNNQQFMTIKSQNLQTSNQLYIQNSTFKNNFCQNDGGSIYLNATNNLVASIANSIFSNNTSKNNGGAIYSNQLLPQTQSTISIISSLILNNQANKGAVYYSLSNPINLQDPSNYIQNNKALEFGAEDVFIPSSFLLIYDKGQFNNLYAINLTSQTLDVNFYGVFLTNHREQFKEIKDDIYLNLVYDSSVLSITPQNIPFQNGVFNLTKELTIYGKLGMKIQVQLKLIYSNQKYSNVFNQINNYLENQKITFQLQQYCYPGQQIVQVKGKYDTCTQCQYQFYSLEQNSKYCSKCNIDAAVCYQDQILLKNGYWRENNKSDIILSCSDNNQNCIGDLNPYDESRQSQKKFNSTQNYYCKVGHIGALCQDCDLMAQYWKDSFMQYGNKQCINCKNTQNILIIFLVILAFFVVFALIQIYQIIKSTYNQILIKYCKLIGLDTKQVITKTDDTAIYIKILVNYLQILSIIIDADIGIPFQVARIIKSIANPLQSALETQDCLLKEIYQNLQFQFNFIYFRVVASQVFLLLVILCILLLITTWSLLLRKTHYLKSYFKVAILYFLIANQPGVLNIILGTASCNQIGSKYYIKQYSSIECNQNHMVYSLTLLFPILLVWTLIFQALLFFLLRTKRFDLDKIKVRIGFGYLYQEYTLKTYQWEQIKIFQKTFLIFSSNLLFSNSILNLACQLLINLIYKLLSNHIKPYQSAKLNKLDNQCSNIGCISLGLGIIMTQSKQIYLELAALFLLAIINFFGLTLIFLRVFEQKIDKLKQLFESIYPFLLRSQFFKKHFMHKIHFIPRKKITDLWGFLRKLLTKQKLKYTKLQRKEEFYLIKMKRYYNHSQNMLTQVTLEKHKIQKILKKNLEKIQARTSTSNLEISQVNYLNASIEFAQNRSFDVLEELDQQEKKSKLQ